MIRKFFLLSTALFIFQFAPFYAQAQSITLERAEAQFLQSNLILLAGQYNIDANKALAIQAEAYPNPVFSADFNLIDPQNKRVLHAGSTGQKAFGIEQLILLGGKRKSQIEIAKKNQALAESELADLLRNLRYQLQVNFYSLYQQQTVIEGYNSQLILLDTLIHYYDQQAPKGNVALKEVVRLRSVYIRLSSDRSEYAQNKIETMKTLQLLLKDSAQIVTAVDNQFFENLLAKPIQTDLAQIAKAKRPDLMAAQQNKELAALNLKLQKQLAIPDLTLNSTYDQRGGAFVNQVNLGFELPIPVWNRNKGNISAADAIQKSLSINQNQKELEVSLEVQAAVVDLQRSSVEYAKAKRLYNADFEVVFAGMNENFRKRNLSLLEFVDFFEAYNESKTDFERIKAQLALAASKINFVTASKVY